MLAERRVGEIDELKAKHPSSTLIKTLGDNLSEDISSSLSIAANASATTTAPLRPARHGEEKNNEVRIGILCKISMSALQNSLSDYPELLSRFNTRCNDGIATSTATTTITGSTTTTTILPTSTTIETNISASATPKQQRDNNSEEGHDQKPFSLPKLPF